MKKLSKFSSLYDRIISQQPVGENIPFWAKDFFADSGARDCAKVDDIRAFEQQIQRKNREMLDRKDKLVWIALGYIEKFENDVTAEMWRFSVQVPLDTCRTEQQVIDYVESRLKQKCDTLYDYAVGVYEVHTGPRMYKEDAVYRV